MAVVVRAMLPKDFNKEAVARVLEQSTRKYAPMIIKDYKSTIAGWKGEKPRFQSRVFVRKLGIKIVVAFYGSQHAKDKWGWLDQGTKPHLIVPVRARRLRFQTPYSRGSSPGRLKTSAGRRGSNTVYSAYSNHPGTVALNWNKMIAKKHDKLWFRWMLQAMKEVAKATNHAYKR